MTNLRRRYNMFPNKTYGGHVDTEILNDGRIKYFINITGQETPNEIVVDPSDENEMRAVRQLHLISGRDTVGTTDGSEFVVDADDVDTLLAKVGEMARKLGQTGS